MALQPQRRYTLEEYFALERASEGKYEYWYGEVYAMSGASPAHVQIQINLITLLSLQLRGRSCRLFSSDMRLKVPDFPPYRYPDLSALCGESVFESIGGLDVLTNPALIIEILSPSTEAFDRGDKFTYYKSIPSFREYLLIAQHRPHVGHYIKQNNAIWSYQEYNELGLTLTLPALDCHLALEEVYRAVTFIAQPVQGRPE
ncbi:MAG: Uma2 family endonuclease [Candidatus Tectimicrobiota bacterium]